MSAIRRRASRRRTSLATTIDLVLDPRRARRRGLVGYPRIPAAHAAAVVEPLAAIAALLRDPAIAVADDACARILLLVVSPTSALHRGPVNRARFAVLAALDELDPVLASDQILKAS